MAYRRARGLGQNTLATTWQDFLDFWNPSLTTSTVAANIYQRAQYGNIPTPTPGTVPGGAAPNLPVTYDPSTGLVTDNTTGATVQITDPTQRATALTDLINQAIASGNYTPAGAPVASTLGSIPGWVWALGAGLGGVLLLSLAMGGRR